MTERIPRRNISEQIAAGESAQLAAAGAAHAAERRRQARVPELQTAAGKIIRDYATDTADALRERGITPRTKLLTTNGVTHDAWLVTCQKRTTIANKGRGMHGMVAVDVGTVYEGVALDARGSLLAFRDTPSNGRQQFNDDNHIPLAGVKVVSPTTQCFKGPLMDDGPATNEQIVPAESVRPDVEADAQPAVQMFYDSLLRLAQQETSRSQTAR